MNLGSIRKGRIEHVQPQQIPYAKPVLQMNSGNPLPALSTSIESLEKRKLTYQSVLNDIDKRLAAIQTDLFNRNRCANCLKLLNESKDIIISIDRILLDIKTLVTEGASTETRRISQPVIHDPSLAYSMYDNKLSMNNDTSPISAPIDTNESDKRQIDVSQHGPMLSKRRLDMIQSIIDTRWINALNPVKAWLTDNSKTQITKPETSSMNKDPETSELNLPLSVIQKSLNNITQPESLVDPQYSESTPAVNPKDQTINWWDAIGLMLSSDMIFPHVFFGKKYWSSSEMVFVQKMKHILHEWNQIWNDPVISSAPSNMQQGGTERARDVFSKLVRCIGEITQSNSEGGVDVQYVLEMGDASQISKLNSDLSIQTRNKNEAIEEIAYISNRIASKQSAVPRLTNPNAAPVGPAPAPLPPHAPKI